MDRSGAERKPAPGGHEQGGSWQCRNAGKVKVWSSFLVGSESDVWQSGIRAAGLIRPSLPWCFSPATRSLDSSLDRSGAERKPAPGGHEQGGSWQCRNAGKVKVWTLEPQNKSRLQEDTSRVAVGSAETQEKSRFGASF